jgi:phospholipase/carboxylesterase
MNDAESRRYRERPAVGDAAGILVLHHGRGTSEEDLIGLADVFDPVRRLHVVAPRGPLDLPGQPGFHWYRTMRVGYPDPPSFFDAKDALARFHDSVWERTGIGPERTVLGGFSMGAVMSYALAFSADRPPVAGVLAMSGFLPTVEGWEPQFDDRRSTHVLIAHGSGDPVIGVDFARQAKELLAAAGLAVGYRESFAAHNIDPSDVVPIAAWLDATLST